MSTAAIGSVARQIIKGSKHWPHKSPALTVRNVGQLRNAVTILIVISVVHA